MLPAVATIKVFSDSFALNSNCRVDGTPRSDFAIHSTADIFGEVRPPLSMTILGSPPKAVARKSVYAICVN
jgi:hypothetical protein